MNWLKDHLVTLVLPLLIAPLASFLSKQALNLNIWVDRLPAWAKQGVVFAIAALLTAAGAQIPGFLPEGVVPELAVADWQVFAAWLAALVWHDNRKKAK
ncbi:MAG: hypothetical protein KIS74_03115 [Burkholderiales bacterium]|nr:hypothetical protein [Burkholderiales bacterium]